MTSTLPHGRAAIAALVLAALAAYPELGRAAADDHSHHASAANTGELTAGEVRKVDAANGKLTIKHEAISNLDMPAMTMVFQVRELTLLAGLKPGERIRFRAENPGGTLTVTEIRRGK